MQSVIVGSVGSSVVGLLAVLGFIVIVVGAPIVFIVFLIQMLRDR